MLNHTPFSRPWLLIVPLGLILAALCAPVPNRARADAAPAYGIPGGSLTPITVTNVQMVNETVTLELAQLNFTAGFGQYDELFTQLGVKVTAEFLFRNLDSVPQHLTVGFPLYSGLTVDKGDSYYNIVNFRAFVNGVEVTTKRSKVNDEFWAAWEMDFAPGDSQLRVTYDSAATSDACNAEFGYVLHTGAGWAGNIGQADIILRFGYPAESLLVGDGALYLRPAPRNFVAKDFDLIWHYEDFEPTEADDFSATVVVPDCWREVARARAALLKDASAQNYWQTAKAFAEIVFPHHGFESKAIAQTAEEMYRKAIELDPDNGELRSEFEGFIAIQAGWLLPTEEAAVLTQSAPTPGPATPTAVPLTRTTIATLTLHPATTDTPLNTPTSPSRATSTEQPASTPVPTSTPTSGSSPLCGGS